MRYSRVFCCADDLDGGRAFTRLFCVGFRSHNLRCLFSLHADFLSHLAMMFNHGNYACVDAIESKERIAEDLFKRAIAYGPDHWAFLGLGIIKQKNRKTDESISIQQLDLAHYPDSHHLNMCLGINFMNKAMFDSSSLNSEIFLLKPPLSLICCPIVYYALLIFLNRFLPG